MAGRRRQRLRNGIAFVLLILVSAAVGILVVMNEGSARLALPGYVIEAPLVILLGVFALLGVLLTAAIFLLRIRRLNRKIADLRDQNRALQVEVEQMRTAPMRDFY